MQKAEDAIKEEEDRVAPNGYLHVSSKPKLLKEVEHEVLAVHQAALLEKENSGCAALLMDDKVIALVSCPASGLVCDGSGCAALLMDNMVNCSFA